MPYKSESQRRFFNSEAGKEKLGEAEVEHWNKESEGMKLPEKVNDTLDKAIKACDDMYQEIESAGPYMLTKSNSGRWAVLRNGMPIKYGMEKEMRELYKKVLKANGYAIDKAISACDAGTEVIKFKNGYTLGRNNGKLVIAFTYKGETLNNPHMWLGVENASNMSKAEELFENLAKTRSGKTKDADKPSILLEELKRNVSRTKSLVDEIERLKKEVCKLDEEFNQLRSTMMREYKDNDSAMEGLKMQVAARNRIR